MTSSPINIWTKLLTKANSWGQALYQGPIATNFILPEAIAQLHARCPACTAVRIEQDR